ncbi:MAG: arsinothricin resistance N-acetyltransferase ArsN1 family B [Pseudonocardiaceae bacterium]
MTETRLSRPVSHSFRVRPATVDDARAMSAIYAPFVEHTAISFELIPPTAEEFAERIRHTAGELPWVAAETDEGLVGYAYANRHQVRGAYRWSVDTSVYVTGQWHGRGVGLALYHVLLDELRTLGYVSAYAGITLPNTGSVSLHEKLGFVAIGCFPDVGFKQGCWHDVGWWHLALREPPLAPPEPARWNP